MALAPRINMSDFASSFSDVGTQFGNMGRTTNRFTEVVKQTSPVAPRSSRGDVSRAPRFSTMPGQSSIQRLGGNTAQRAMSGFSQAGGSASRLMTAAPMQMLGKLDPLGIYRNQAAPVQGGMAGGTGATNTGVPQLDAHNAELAVASAQFGIPVNVLKVVLNRESSGDWSRDGSRLVGLRGDRLMPFVGIFKGTWDSWGCAPNFDAAVGNKQAQINCMAKGLSDWYRKAQATDPSYGWAEVFSMYFSGRYKPIGWADENGLTDFDYVNAAMKTLRDFDAADAGQPMGGAPSAGGAVGGAISTIWGNTGGKDLSYGFGAANGSGIPGLYNYAAANGLPGDRHPAIDIPGNIGDPAYSATSGTVVCACTGNGAGADGGGCGAFNDYLGNGCGRIEVKLDNGHTVIYGHMSSSTVKVGQRVTAGQQIGAIGGMNGPHIHLEYRIPDSSVAAGWRVVDPAAYLGGAASSPQPGSPTQQQAQQPFQMTYPGSAPWNTGSGSLVYRPVSSWRY